ncbi:MAG: sulfite exporter TauE/SafE family protein [Thermoplasmata archaeon]|nr:sulfite exporter TauE/SafE family protein [Thermoplasmata archaeon]
MDFWTIALLIVMVFGVAFVYSNLGLGGGLLYVPILLSFTPYVKEVVVPISLTFTVATALSATLNHRRKGLVDFNLALMLLTGALIGAVLGVLFNLKVREEVFYSVFIAVILIMSSKMLWDWIREARDEDADDDSKLTRPRKIASSTGTLASGFTSGSLGIGGGLINVPLMEYVLGRGARRAIGTSSLMIIFTGAFGFMTYLFLGTPEPIDFNLIFLLWPLVFVGAFVGSRWGLEKLKSRMVALIFIIVIFLAAAKMSIDLYSILT